MIKLWAVARHTWIEALRSKVTAVFALGLGATVLLLPRAATEGQPLDRIQTYLADSVGLVTLLLASLTILLTCGVLCGEVSKRYAFTSMTKPLARWKYILGRWLGLLMLQAMLLGLAGAGMYAMVQSMRQGTADPAQRFDVDSEVITARQEAQPDRGELDMRLGRFVEARVEQMAKDGQIPAIRDDDPTHTRAQDPTQQAALDARRADLESQGRQLLQSAPARPMGSEVVSLQWLFAGLQRPADPQAKIQFKFTAKATRPPEDDMIRGMWEFFSPGDQQSVRVVRGDKLNIRNTIDVPAQVIGADGRLVVQSTTTPGPRRRRPWASP